MKIAPIDPDKASDINWDFIIIGAGMGGSSIGHALSSAGKKILFCDSGFINRNEETLSGKYSEEFFSSKSKINKINVLKKSGRYFNYIVDKTSSASSFVPFIGSGGGGSSALFGMAMERFFPQDFDSWPVSYEEMVPYYEKVEAQFRVKGEKDPFLPVYSLLPGPKLSPPNKEIFEFLKNQGFRPYHLPMACEYVRNCSECSGYICPLDKNCKNDAFKIYLSPAIENFGASYLQSCTVLELMTENDLVTSANCVVDGKSFYLKASNWIIAAGALETPKLLLKSKSKHFLNGLANSSQLVGTNLMRHLVDLYTLKTKAEIKNSYLVKQIAISDLIFKGNKQLGILQSFGKAVAPESVLEEILSPCPFFIRKLLSVFDLIILNIIKYFFQNKLIFATISEDLPHVKNCLKINANNEIEINYQCDSTLMNRQSILRAEIKKIFTSFNVKLIQQADNNKRIAHACGTCRFGKDSKSSVLNEYNQAHDVKNLYIVDSSFFPSSSAKNPALTIAANAQRVADYILRK